MFGSIPTVYVGDNSEFTANFEYAVYVFATSELSGYCDVCFENSSAVSVDVPEVYNS